MSGDARARTHASTHARFGKAFGLPRARITPSALSVLCSAICWARSDMVPRGVCACTCGAVAITCFCAPSTCALKSKQQLKLEHAVLFPCYANSTGGVDM